MTLAWAVFAIAAGPRGAVTDIARLAKAHGLRAVPVERSARFDQAFGEPVARYESTVLTTQQKEKLWKEFVRVMTPYGKPYGPMCGYALMGYAAEGIEPTYIGSGQSGDRYYHYELEETSGPVKTVVLKLHCHRATRKG